MLFLGLTPQAVRCRPLRGFSDGAWDLFLTPLAVYATGPQGWNFGFVAGYRSDRLLSRSLSRARD
jgi:hypothetical protein